MTTDRPMQKLKLSWNTIHEAVDVLCYMAKPLQPSLIVAIARGGLIPGTLMSHRLGIPLSTITASAYEGTRRTLEKPIEITGWKGEYNRKDVIVVDDIMDTGVTFDSLLYKRGSGSPIDFEPQLMTLVKKTGARFPNFKSYFIQVPSDMWVEFPWEEGES